MKNLKDKILENKFSQNTILEKLVFNKHTKSKQQELKSVKDIDIPWRLDAHFNVYSDKQKDACMNKMTAYYNKQSKVTTLINTIKDSTKLVNRWYCAVLLEWDEAIQKFGEEIENRNIATVDQLSAYLYRCYNKSQTSITIHAKEYGQDGDVNIYKKHLEHYFDLYNIEY